DTHVALDVAEVVAGRADVDGMGAAAQVDRHRHVGEGVVDIDRISACQRVDENLLNGGGLHREDGKRAVDEDLENAWDVGIARQIRPPLSRTYASRQFEGRVWIASTALPG